MQSNIEINAPAERVWQILTDLQSYVSWNPLFQGADGELKQGRRITLEVDPPGNLATRIKVRVATINHPHKIKLTFVTLATWLMEGVLVYELFDNGTTSRIRQQLELRGLLVPFVPESLLMSIQVGLDSLTLELKKWSETGAAEAPDIAAAGRSKKWFRFSLPFLRKKPDVFGTFQSS